MVLNNFRHDMKVLMANEELNTVSLAKLSGKTQPNISRLMGSRIILESFEEVIEAMGYDIKIEYIKRKD